MRLFIQGILDGIWSRPLGLPTGSVRAILAIAVVGVVLLEIRTAEGPVPVEIIGLLLLVLGGYGFIRREQGQQEEHRKDMIELDSVREAALYRARTAYDASLERKGEAGDAGERSGTVPAQPPSE